MKRGAGIATHGNTTLTGSQVESVLALRGAWHCSELHFILNLEF
jgi:hypothetical protein